MPSSDTVLARLRSATRESHQQLETQLDVMSRLSSGTERQRLVAGYQMLYSSAVTLLAPWFEGAEPGPATSMTPVEIHSRAEALGFRYVIEGSALGGRVILRALEAQGVDTAELGFLNPHGAKTGQVWRSFMALLERDLAAPGALDEAVTGAVKGFAYAQICLGHVA